MRVRTLTAVIAVSIITAPGLTQAFIDNFEFSGQIDSEAGIFVKDGATIGDKSGVDQENEHDAGDFWKFQNRLKVYLNGDLGERTSFHAEGSFVINPKAADSDFKTHRLYSQYDYFRELYIDSYFGDEDQFTIRFGKQQVVWGTADGIKLLDIINPTDFRFLNQSPFEESRIPVWMVVPEYNPTPNTNLQLVVAQSRPNVIPGLSADGDTGEPFILKGVDTITGQVDGFLNIVPALGSTARAFQEFVPPFTDPSAPDPKPPGGPFGSLSFVGGDFFTVQDFISGFTPFCNGGVNPDGTVIPGQNPNVPGLGASNCAEMLNAIAQTTGPSAFGTQLGGNNNSTNLAGQKYNASNPLFTFEYMPDASFATFDTFARAKSAYRQDLSNDEANVGFRFKQTTDSGINYSLNYLYALDNNPAVEIFWEDEQRKKLTPVETTNKVFTPGGDPVLLPDGKQKEVTTVSLNNGNGTAFTPTDALGNKNDGTPTLVFREFRNRIHNIGASFDSAFDFGDLPIVLRGEFLYQKDVNVPFINRNKLAIGNFSEGLRPDEVDFFRYVLGVDVTVWTNLLVSTQLIQFWNLDYENNKVDAQGKSCTTRNCGSYHGDPATLSLSNNQRVGDEVETFGSLFFSKPFGAEQQHRWNNILIAENHGGFWNRFDLEYAFTDISENFIGTFAWNHYFGDENTLFGQLKNSSNVLVGLKFLFDPE